MNISSFKAFALKPRKLANTFWLWGVLYPWLLVVFWLYIVELFDVIWDTFGSVISSLTYSAISSSYEFYICCRHAYDDYIFSFFITLFTIEVFFALFLTFRASKSIGMGSFQLMGIAQLLVMIFPLFIIYSLHASGGV